LSALILDTSGLLALSDKKSKGHRQAVAIASQFTDWLLSAAILAEVDYMLSTRIGSHATDTLLKSISDGELLIEPYFPQDIRYSIETSKKYRQLELGLADCAVMALSERLHLPTILSLDSHFSIVKPSAFGAFQLPLLS
jgi:uncharacterized protein